MPHPVFQKPKLIQKPFRTQCHFHMVDEHKTQRTGPSDSSESLVRTDQNTQRLTSLSHCTRTHSIATQNLQCLP